MEKTGAVVPSEGPTTRRRSVMIDLLLSSSFPLAVGWVGLTLQKQQVLIFLFFFLLEKKCQGLFMTPRLTG